jgi:release factor glutamine methyltransferase
MAKQPYEFAFQDIVLTIEKDVFPPDIGYTTMLMAEVLLQRRASSALDMGTGSLFLALVMRTAGIREVWAADNHAPAVQCSKNNLERNSRLAPIHIVSSDLFDGIEKGKLFDLIAFNQPYYPIHDRTIVGMGDDGGRAIIERFLQQANAHLAEDGEILMPYSSIAGEANNPGAIARSLHWDVAVVGTRSGNGVDHLVYAIRR